jgi:hypothetical protein
VAVRRYLGRLAVRYTPLLAVGLALVLVRVLTPPVTVKSNGSRAVGAGVSNGDATGNGSTAAGAAGGGGPAAAAGTGASNAAAGPAARPRQVALAAGITPPAAAGSAGVTRSGVRCGPGVRQVPWSVYAPTCVPAYSGNNGGTTAHGVSGDTVLASFRRTGSAEEKAAYAAVGAAAPGTDDQYLHDLRTYVDYFNKNFELYGRHVVVKDFNGQGDNLQEDQGQDLAAAQADAATAHDLGAFVDITQSPTLASTQPYEEGLSQEKVVNIGALGLPQSWHEQFSPYAYSFPLSPDGTTGAAGVVNGVCAHMAALPAIYAGDPLYQKQTRVWGLVTPDNPVYIELGNEIEQGLKRCGVTLAKRVRYTINVALMGQESVSVVAQLKSANVTTPICICDPIVEITISQSAQNQQYKPEWVAVGWGDPQGRDMQQDQWHNTLAYEGTYPVKKQTEAYRVFKAADPQGEPQEQYYPDAYYMALYLFDVLQAAGPDLTPVSFRQGAFAMPRSSTGDIGVWGGGPNRYGPVLTAQIGRWEPKATSGFDGMAGAWQSCDGGTWYPYLDAAAWGAPHTQFQCPP